MLKVTEAIEASNVNKGGRPSHSPTEETRNIVTLMFGVGIPEELISSALKISIPTLIKHYKKELKCAKARMQAQCVANLSRLAQGNDGTAFRANEFLLNCRFGWSRYAPPAVTREPELGKKEKMERAAQTGHEETGWGDLLQ